MRRNQIKQVAVLMGSDTDIPAMKESIKILDKFRIGVDVKVLSAHRTPEQTVRYVHEAPKKGIKVFIAAAGGAAHLAGVVAAHTILPVIGVPIESKSLKGLDSLLSIVQMPGGIPVGTMAIGASGAKNAGIYAAQILGLSDKHISRNLEQYKREMAKAVEAKNQGLMQKCRS